MGTKVSVSPDEYLATRFSGRQPEYVHGELKEKSLPDSFHAFIQAVLAEYLTETRRKYKLQTRTENQCRLADDLYRIPDLALFHLEPFEPVPTTPPIMITEIVSRDDSRYDLMAKLRDCASWGVSNIWIVDPWLRRLAIWRDDTEIPVEKLELPEFGFSVTLEQLTEGLPR